MNQCRAVMWHLGCPKTVFRCHRLLRISQPPQRLSVDRTSTRIIAWRSQHSTGSDGPTPGNLHTTLSATGAHDRPTPAGSNIISPPARDAHGGTAQINRTHFPPTPGERGSGTAQKVSAEKPRPFHTMPGPGGIYRVPYLGAMLLFAPFTKHTPENFGQMIAEMHRQYGPIFRTRLGGKYSVHSMNAEDFEKVFEADGQYPERRYLNLSRVYRKRNKLPHELGTVHGPEWHALRSPLNKLVNRPQVMLSYLTVQNDVADDFVKLLQDRGNTMSPEEQSELFFRFSTENIGLLCFNTRLGFLSPNMGDNVEQKKLLEAVETALDSTFKDLIGAEQKYILTEHDAFYQKYEAAMKYIKHTSSQYTQRIIEGVKRTGGKDVDTEANLMVDLITQSGLNMEQILAIIDALFIAGVDSTAGSLAVLLYSLAKNPDAQSKAAIEVDAVLGPDGKVTAENLNKLRYVKACVRESMRLNSPAPGPQRNLTRDVTLSGYHVPKGTEVFMASCLTQLDPSLFSDPLSFQPERWLRAHGDSKSELTETVSTDQDQQSCPVHQSNHRTRTLSFAFLPFGHGPRSCIGRRFAEQELYLALARVLQRFDVRLKDGFGDIDVYHRPFITPREPIPFRFQPRHRQ